MLLAPLTSQNQVAGMRHAGYDAMHNLMKEGITSETFDCGSRASGPRIARHPVLVHFRGTIGARRAARRFLRAESCVYFGLIPVCRGPGAGYQSEGSCAFFFDV